MRKGLAMSTWTDDVPPVAKSHGEASAAEVFVAWERLRLVYNAVLIAVTLVLGARHLGDERFQIRLVEGAILANALFCAGIVAEGYLALLGFARRPCRITLFALGTLLAAGLAALSVSVVPLFPGGGD